MVGQRIRLGIVIALGMTLGAVLLPPDADASAADGTHLDCSFKNHVTFTPGISPEVKEIRIASSEPGPLRCTGTWAGQELTGTGLGAFEGDAVGTCAASTIDAVLRIDHPLAGGDRLQVAVPIRAGRAGTVIYGVGADSSRPASIVGNGTPDKGQNCVFTPITGITAEGRVLVAQPQATFGGELLHPDVHDQLTRPMS